MKLNDTFDLGKPPFQGDRTLEWRRIPLGAQIQRATAIVTPVDATAGSNPFAEIIRFTGATGDWGTTKTQVPQQWVEVDFHGRRTLGRVRGSNLNTAPNNATLQVDLGGAYVEINTNGALSGPDDDPFIIQNPLADGSFALPAMAVTKFKLTTAANPDLTEVTIRSVPTNVSLRFGQQPVFWTRVGELAQAETTPDFAASLEAFLADAEDENGFYAVPLVVHSDAIARLRIEFEIEFVIQQDALPKGLSEVTLPYELDGLPKSSSELITITAPAGSRIVPQSSRARVTGAFADTRIVYDPTETISSEGFVKTIAPAGKVVISGQDSFAQPISLARDTAATAFDLRLEIKEAVKLRLDIREDLDGKPGEVSLLPQPVDVELPGPVGLELSREASDRERWISVPLPAEFQFKEADRQKRYWLALQSIEGEAAWSVAAATAAPQPAETVGLQRLSHRPSDAGLAWREAAATGAGGPLFAFFRLRHLPKRFTMPIAMQVGAGAGAVRVDLGRFQDQGRVDFALDFEELEQARQKHLSKAAPKLCPEAEHLANGEFEKWMAVGGWFTNRTEVPLSFEPSDLAITTDASFLHIVSSSTEMMETVDAVTGIPILPAVSLGINVNRIVTQPFRPIACAAGSTRLLFIDTLTRKVLGNALNVVELIKAIAFNSADNRLYLAASTSLRVFDVLTRTEILSPALPSTPTALAVAPNGQRVYVTIDKGFGQAGEVIVFDVASSSFGNTNVVVGKQPNAIALTPDGKSALVANQASNSISLLDTATQRVITEFQLQQPPVSVAVSPDCGWAYVVTRPGISNAGGTITVIDLVRRAIVDDVVPDPNLKPTPIILKLSPLGDRIFVLGQINTGARRLYAFRRQNLQPEEWNLTSGQITLACLPPSDRTAMLEGLSPRDGSPMPVALSQVTPVGGSCVYDFSFRAAAFDMGTDDNDDDAIAVATDLGAMAEIFWLNDQCGFLKAEPPIPIKVALDMDGGHEALISASAAIINFSDSSSSQLMLHRVRLTAPALATQAEIRFSAPAGVTVSLDRVSLMGTADAVSNGDFQVLSNGQIEGWTFPGGATPGLVVTSLEEGLQLRNNGAATIEMMQTASAKGGESFKLELEGRVLSAGTQSPRLEARWLKAAAAAAASPTAIELRSDTTGSAIAQGQSPPGAEKVEIRLTLPPGAALLVQRISLRFQQMISVPVTFVAQAPGELAITGLQIAFEEGRPAPPPIPDRGLCPPTPPGGQPGTGKSDCSFCPGCESEKSIAEVRAMVTDAGRPVLAGACPDCGAELLRFGGALDVESPRLSFARSIPRQPLAIRTRPERDAGLATTISTAPVTESPAPAETDLTEVSGIGAARAKALKKIGVKTAEALATASPEKVAKAKGFTPAIAQKVISAAKRLIATRF